MCFLYPVFVFLFYHFASHLDFHFLFKTFSTKATLNLSRVHFAETL